MKIILNRCYGGFDLSTHALAYLKQIGWDVEDSIDDSKALRVHPDLIKVVEDLGSEASTWLSNLQIIEIPDDTTDYYISNYDGYETVLFVVEGHIFSR